jgi:hypothetical protein
MSNRASKSDSRPGVTTWAIVGDTLPRLTRRFGLRLTHEQQEGLRLLCDGSACYLPLAKFRSSSSDESHSVAKRVSYACLHSSDWTRYVFDAEYVADVVEAIRQTPDTLEVALSAIGEVLLLPSMMREAASIWGEVASDRQVFESLSGEQHPYATSLAYSLNDGLGAGAVQVDGGDLLGPAALFVAAAEIARARYPELPPLVRRRRA